MKLPNITKAIFTKKVADYTFATLFFLIFSLFIVFAIRPSLSTATALKREETDLQRIDARYESNIANIAAVQAVMEEHRDELPLLTDAVSTHPKVNKMIDDIKAAGDQSTFSLKKENIGEVNLLDTKNKNLQTLHLNVEGTGSFDALMKFIQVLSNQRRLKTIQRMVISKTAEGTATGNGQLNVIMDIEAYYL